MDNFKANKRVLNIWYDNGIKARFTDENKSLSLDDLTKWWSRQVNESLRNFTNEKKIEQRPAVLEYDDVIVYIRNFDMVSGTGFVQNIIKQSRIDMQQKRISSLKKAKERVLSNKDADYEESLEWMHQQLRKKRLASFEQPIHSVKTAELKVTRKNKWSGKKVALTAGVAAALVVAGVAINSLIEDFDKGEFEDVSTSSFNQDGNILQNETIEDNFEIALDINQVMPKPQFPDYEEKYQTYLSYGDESESLKALETKNRYGELIEKYAKKCGLDPRLVLGIATQESGDHEYGLRTGSTGGLMQIEVSFWDGKEIEYYDFDDEQKYLLKITKDAIRDVENNLLIGCAILQNELRSFNYNILLATQSYNMGYSNVSKILDQTSRDIGISKIQIINNQNCLDWLNYTYVPSKGDADYISNVLRYTGYGYHFYEFTCKKPSGESVSITTGPIIPSESKVVS